MIPVDVSPAADRDPQAYLPSRVIRHEHAEGTWTRLIENQTAKIPSDVFLFAALGSVAVSLVLELSGNSRWSQFVALWPAPILSLGIYNKLVKTLGPR